MLRFRRAGCSLEAAACSEGEINSGGTSADSSEPEFGTMSLVGRSGKSVKTDKNLFDVGDRPD